jgi:glycosyltransferase involved in cell wall biosynthesis
MSLKNKIKGLLNSLAVNMFAATIIQPTNTGSNGTPINIGLIAIMKNESLNIREWIDHYVWQGVDKIFLIDNGSDDNTLAVIQEDIHSGLVEYFWCPERHQQTQHYRNVYEAAKIKSKVDWLITADLDEFWFSPLGDLKNAINMVSADADLIYTNWTVFGSSGFIKHPTSIRRELIYRHPKLGGHCNTKWICRTSRIKNARMIGLHKVSGIDSRRVVSDNELFKLNHYVIQSLYYFQEIKMKRGDASKMRLDNIRTIDYFEAYNKPATVLDETLAKMI